ncbi:MAG: SIR2 family NAD-dependent protein deacylase [Endomicrobiales bacterium]
MSEREAALTAAELMKKARRLVAFTGAGISTKAGIPDFRGEKGIYTTGAYGPEVFDIDLFHEDPSVFYAYARDFAGRQERMQPTFAHYFLAEQEQAGALECIITQNIDGLHQKAGARNVLELHGGYGRSYCVDCGKEYCYGELKEKMGQQGVPRCDHCAGVIKPDIIFFGEGVRSFAEAEYTVSRSDCLLVIGTSLAVYPAALLPRLARGPVIVVNKGEVNLPGKQVLAVGEECDDFFRKVKRHLEKLP